MVDPQRQIDTRALERASAADEKAELVMRALERHQDECGKHYRELNEKFDSKEVRRSEQFAALHEKIEKIGSDAGKKWTTVYVGIIVSLAALVGYLLANGAPFQRLP